jgi:hypothetical protein
LFLFFALQAPLKLVLSDSELVLQKVIGKKTIGYDKIANIEIFKPDGTDIRLLGSGGFAGYIGKFKNADIGTYQAYAGNYKQAFLLQTKEQKNYVFSCENRELFIETIKNLTK